MSLRGKTFGWQSYYNSCNEHSSDFFDVWVVKTVEKTSRIYIFENVIFRDEIEAVGKSDRDEIAAVKSDAYDPNAYADGYQEGIANKANWQTYQARSAGGEFARGFEDGYFGRKNTGQRYTELPIKDDRCKCSLLIRRDRLNGRVSLTRLSGDRFEIDRQSL